MKSCLKTVSIILVLSLMLACGMLFLSSCDKKDDGMQAVDYARINDFAVNQEQLIVNPDAVEAQQFGASIYFPAGNVEAKYGFLFFVGTAIPPEKYDYLATALAKQGFVVAIPIVSLNMTYAYYGENTKVVAEKIFEKYSDIEFFVGGHSQGGGAAMRFAYEELERIKGAVFMSPLCYAAHEIERADYDPFDPESERYERDADGKIIYQFDTLANTTLPVLLLEASGDHVLTENMKNDARERMSQNTKRYEISPAAHMSFSTFDDDAILNLFNHDGDGLSQTDKDNQRFLTVSYVLDFLQRLCHNKWLIFDEK
ncbi:MAG: hypothetical protein IJ226_03995 [Clostridia bacterium]|nr:hypothetical protein [Clostridia bacterium]